MIEDAKIYTKHCRRHIKKTVQEAIVNTRRHFVIIGNIRMMTVTQQSLCDYLKAMWASIYKKKQEQFIRKKYYTKYC